MFGFIALSAGLCLEIHPKKVSAFLKMGDESDD